MKTVYISNRIDDKSPAPEKAIGAIFVFADRQSIDEHIKGSNSKVAEINIDSVEARTRIINTAREIMLKNIRPIVPPEELELPIEEKEEE